MQKFKDVRFKFHNGTKEVWHFHLVAFVEQMKMLGYQSDHGDWHDPIINPQIRGYYSSGERNPESNVAGWNPFASLYFKKAKESDTDAYKYGRPQRGGNGHSGIDIYAPVGTPIYAVIDGTITVDGLSSSKISDWIKLLKGKYKNKTEDFYYLHLMEFHDDKFRLLGNSNTPGKFYIKYSELSSTPKKFTFTYTYSKTEHTSSYMISIIGNTLIIDNNKLNLNI